MLNLLKQSQQIAAKTQDEFEQKKSVIEVQEPSVIAAKGIDYYQHFRTVSNRDIYIKISG